MQPTQTQPQAVLESLRKNWVIIIFIGGLIIGWSNFSNRVQNVEALQAKQDAAIKATSDQTVALQNAVIEIKANYLFIKDTLTELKQKN